MSRRAPPAGSTPSGSAAKRPRRSVRIDPDPPAVAGPSTHTSSPLKPDPAGADADADTPAEVDSEAELEAWQDFAADHYEIVEQLPLELHRNFRLLRELDDGALVQMTKLEGLMRGYVAARLALVKQDELEQPAPEEGAPPAEPPAGDDKQGDADVTMEGSPAGKVETAAQPEPTGGAEAEAAVAPADEAGATSAPTVPLPTYPIDSQTQPTSLPPTTPALSTDPTHPTPTSEFNPPPPNPDGPQETPGVPVPDEQGGLVVQPQEGEHVDVKSFPEEGAVTNTPLVDAGVDAGDGADITGEDGAQEPMEVDVPQPSAEAHTKTREMVVDVDVPPQEIKEGAPTALEVGEEGKEPEQQGAPQVDQPDTAQSAVAETNHAEGAATGADKVDGAVTESAAADVGPAPTAVDTPEKAPPAELPVSAEQQAAEQSNPDPASATDPPFLPPPETTSTATPAQSQKPTSLPPKIVRPPGPNASLQEIARLARELVRTGEEKVAVAVGAYNAIDRHIRALDSALTAQEASILLGLRPSTLPSNLIDEALEMDQGGSGKTTTPAGPSSGGAAGAGAGVAGAVPGPGGNTRTRKNAIVEPLDEPDRGKARADPKGKGKARADDVPGDGQGDGGQGREGREESYSIPADPNEPRYCYCNKVSYGEMIGCDNDECPLEWFHLSCAGLDAPPTGKWWCRICAPKFAPAAGAGGSGGGSGGGGRARSRGGGGGKGRVSGGRKR
ncbi:hypothetical protein IAT38_002297 [Cryptococcus sp. DSM 104549]